MIAIQPLDPEDASAITPMKAAMRAAKGARSATIDARAQFDALIGRVPPRGDVTFETATFFTIGASLLQPVFTGGRTRSQVELAEARRDEILLAYQQTILQSLRDVSDALIAYRRNREFRDQQQL